MYVQSDTFLSDSERRLVPFAPFRLYGQSTAKADKQYDGRNCSPSPLRVPT